MNVFVFNINERGGMKRTSRSKRTASIGFLATLHYIQQERRGPFTNKLPSRENLGNAEQMEFRSKSEVDKKEWKKTQHNQTWTSQD